MGCLLRFLIRWINNLAWRLLLNFYWLSFQMFQPLIVLYRRGNFVYHHWRCTSIYRTLSYPFRPVSKFTLTFRSSNFYYCKMENSELLCIWCQIYDSYANSFKSANGLSIYNITSQIVELENCKFVLAFEG